MGQMNEQTMIDLVNKIAANDKVAPFQNGFVVLTNQEMVKLVELIINECADIASINGYQVEPPGYYVRKHFGVE
jgi:hypothetical protein